MQYGTKMSIWQQTECDNHINADQVHVVDVQLQT